MIKIFKTISLRYIIIAVSGFCLFIGSIPFLVHSIEQRTIPNEIRTFIQKYYALYNKHQLVLADQIVDHRLKHVSENGAVQQFLIRDEVLYGARRFEHQLKYLSDYVFIQTPDQFHIQTTGDVVIASFLLNREKRLKEDDSVIEQLRFRVTWVLAQKEDGWIVLHEHQSTYLPD